MKVLVIGGSQGIGKNIVDYYNPNSFSVSRENGYNINDFLKRKEICEISLNYDCVVNHAYSGNENQFNMLKELISFWKEEKKGGYIFNTGTINTYYTKNDWNLYPIYKLQQDELCKRTAKKVQENQYPFRITNIRPGMLDTLKSRKKSHWPGSGVTSDNYCKVINFLYQLPEEVVIPEFIIETRVP